MIGVFAAGYAATFPERHLALCPLRGRSVPLPLRLWVETGIVLDWTGRAPRFPERWSGGEPWRGRPLFVWFRW